MVVRAWPGGGGEWRLTVSQGQDFRLVIQKVLKMGGGDEECV